MKLLKILVAAAATCAMFSCVTNDPNPKKEDNVKMVVKFENVLNRAETEPVGSGYVSTFNPVGAVHHIFVISHPQNEVITHETFEVADLDTDKLEITTTTDAAEVLVVANAPADFSGASYATKAAVEGAAMALANLAPAPDSNPLEQNGHGVKYALLYNETTAGVTTNNDQLEASVALLPVVVRFEIAEVAGTLPVSSELSKISSYTLSGIYMNRVYTHLTLANNGTGSTGFLKGEVYPATAARGDWSFNTYTTFTGQNTYSPADGKVWAYHVSPVTGTVVGGFDTVNTSDVPNIVLHLTDVVFTDPTIIPTQGDLYITVSGYKDASSNDVTKFERGYVYTIEKIEFNETHVKYTPDPESITLTATISVKPWQFKPIEPVI